MYKVNPHYQLPEDIELPASMYRAAPINPSIKLAPVSVNYINGGANYSESHEDFIAEKMKSAVSISSSSSKSSVPTSTSTSKSQLLIPEDKLALIEERQLILIEKLAGLQQMITILHEQELMKLKITQSGRLVITTEEDSNEDDTSGSGAIDDFVDVVINADPNQPPYSILFFYKLLQQVFGEGSIVLRTFVHSSATELINKVNRNYLEIFNVNQDDAANANAKKNKVRKVRMTISIIWKKLTNNETELILSPINKTLLVNGEENIVRYFSRILPKNDPRFQYINYDGLTTNNLQAIDKILNGQNNNDQRLRNITSLEQHLNKLNINAGNNIGQVSEFVIGGKEPTIADFILYSKVVGQQLIQSGNQEFISKYTNVLKWLWSLQEFSGFKLFTI